MQKVCNSEDGGLNDALKLARRVENDGVVASAALELSGSWATTMRNASCMHQRRVPYAGGGECGHRKTPHGERVVGAYTTSSGGSERSVWVMYGYHLGLAY